MVVIPERHFAMAVLANMDGVELLGAAQEILELYGMPHPNRTKK